MTKFHILRKWKAKKKIAETYQGVRVGRLVRRTSVLRSHFIPPSARISPSTPLPPSPLVPSNHPVFRCCHGIVVNYEKLGFGFTILTKLRTFRITFYMALHGLKCLTKFVYYVFQ